MLTFPFAELLEQGADVFGQGGFEGMGRALCVGELEQMGVQGETGEEGAFVFLVAGEFEVAFEGAKKNRFGVAVEFVADDRVAERLHVYADLVGAAGMDLELHQGK